jgi:lipopolysaccharide transport system ATP-binding protein
MSSILEIKGISKKFSISHESRTYLTMRDSLRSLFRKTNTSKEEFWALKDIEFNVEEGESVGIIGRNGAGKSTLLKILSKITPPSSGRVISRGRLASLLEVGTGFHSELTGRENVYFNGSIMGMKRKEIDARFDEIIDFAGTEKFLDTPLKHYSSGMQLRLAFAVSAFLEPEILVIDEVLAVGDAKFQQKCLGKMEDVTKSGRTILFVSHNMAAVEKLCNRTIWLESGKIMTQGPSGDIIPQYLKTGAENSNSADQTFPLTTKDAQVERLEFLTRSKHSQVLYMGNDLEVKLHYRSDVILDNPMMGIIIYDSSGSPVLFFNNKNYNAFFGKRSDKHGVISMHIPAVNLMPGFYSVDIYFSNLLTDLDVKKSCFNFQIMYQSFENAGEPLIEKYNKVFYKDVRWEFEAKNEVK